MLNKTSITPRVCRRLMWGAILAAALPLAACAGLLGRPPKGGEAELSAQQQAALERVRQQVDGWIVWSSSRFGNHDLLLMKTDGSELKRLTQGEHVDWYPRFSQDGKQILFTRSKGGWVSEKDANRSELWDLYLIDVSGGAPRKIVDNASWAEWIGEKTILFSRKTQVLTKQLPQGQERLLIDSVQVAGLGGADLQNPHLSPDGKYLAITLRGSKRETGILQLETQTWTKTGEGCQINWFPAGDRILWVNPSGNGGSEVFSIRIKGGKPAQSLEYAAMRWIDIPGRRSHEYFPQLDRGGHWLVWAATQRGHDHDIADYEIYLWRVGAPADQAVRLTFHSGNDRWPDIYVPLPQKGQ